MTLESFKHLLLGKPLDPFKQETRKHLALITFFAWVGLGADGISSSAYGPEEAFAALGDHTQLALFLAIATGVTVFLIALSYLQVIEMFPKGGGGYKVASRLLGPRAGLVSGCALVVDYVLTIAISIASAVDSLFSVLPPEWQPYKIGLEFLLVMLLAYMNLRGMKESIRMLMPIFLGFVTIHVVLILYGILGHYSTLGDLLPRATGETGRMVDDMGWYAVLALFFKAFSLGGGTYTGLEAVSNSVQNLAEPRVKTGKMTMFCVASSLAFMATGIILLYLLWDVHRVPGQTMNATAFNKITADWTIGNVVVSYYVVSAAMFLTAGLLFVAANTGFIAGPAVLASMAVDRWMPHLFSLLSSRLVTKNGVMLMAASALFALTITRGKVDVLVVLYSINVFLTFTLSLAGLCRYRWRRRRKLRHLWKFFLALLAFLVCGAILITTLFEKFLFGAWMTVLITGILIMLGLLTRRHYARVQTAIERSEQELAHTFASESGKAVRRPRPSRLNPTAVFLVSETGASGMHMFLWVQKAFPHAFRNFIFVSVGEIDTEEFVDDDKWSSLRKTTDTLLTSYVDYCNAKGFSATCYQAFGTDVVKELTELTARIANEYPKAVFFATKIISDNENFITQILHNQTAYILQRRLHNRGQNMIITPMKL